MDRDDRFILCYKKVKSFQVIYFQQHPELKPPVLSILKILMNNLFTYSFFKQHTASTEHFLLQAVIGNADTRFNTLNLYPLLYVIFRASSSVV